MSTLLVGSEVISYPNTAFFYADHAFEFTAEASDTLDTLELYVVSAVGVTALYLSIYADAADSPGALLGYGEVASPSSYANAWAPATGLSVAITAGTKYWLAVTSIGEPVEGFLAYEDALEVVTDNGVAYTTAPGDPWRGIADGTVSRDNGPTAFRGMSGGPGGPGVEEVTAQRPSDLAWHVTGLWYPGETSVAYYGQIVDPAGDSYVDTLNDQSIGEVTFNVHAQNPDLLANTLGKAYARFLKVYDSGELAFWGPYKLGTIDMNAGTASLNCVDPSLRLSRHVLRRGDLVIGEGASGGLTEANDDQGQVPVDHTGLRLLRDAGKNTTEQTDEGYPDLGIDDGSNDYVATPFNLMGVRRLDQVFNAMKQLSDSLGPDFAFRAVEDVVGAYALLDTFAHQGSDLSHEIVFHWGTGEQNLENLVVTEGAKYTTHIHVLPRDIKRYRFTQANADAAKVTGPYVDADATDYDSEGIDPEKVEEVLRAYGDDYLAAYGRPLVEVVLTLPVDASGVPRYRVDFNLGDTVGVAGRIKASDSVTLWDLPPAPFRITSVRRKRDGDGIRSEITVVGDMVAAAGDSIAGSGATDEAS